MVSVAAPSLTTLPLAVTSSKSRLVPFRNSFLINVPKKHISVSCSAKFLGMEHFHDPTKLIGLLNKTKENLWKSMPDSVKSFPWKKAESFALKEFLVLVKETLKWSVLAFFAFSFLSDALYSISVNKELVIPLGLFVGSITTKFFNEILRELVPDHQDGCTTWRFLGIASFFVLVKVTSSYFSGASDFLLHAVNGGLIQVLWNCRDSKTRGSKIFFRWYFKSGSCC